LSDNSPKDRKASEDSPEKSEPDRSSRRSDKSVRLPYILFIVFVLAHAIFFISSGEVTTSVPEIDDIATEEVIAPFTFPVLKTESELLQERNIVKRNVPVILNYDDKISRRAIEDFDSLWNRLEDILEDRRITQVSKPESIAVLFPDLSTESAQILAESRKISQIRIEIKEVIEEIYQKGVFEWKSLEDFDSIQLFSIRRNNLEEVLPTDRVLSLENSYSKLKNLTQDRFEDYPEKGEIIFEITKNFLRPNLLVDYEITQKNRNRALENIKPFVGYVLKDQRIVDAHERIDEDIHRKLTSLAKAKSARFFIKSGLSGFLRAFIKFLLGIFLLGIFTYFVAKFFPFIWEDPAKLGVLLFAVWIPGLFAFLFRLGNIPEVMTPIAFSAVLLAILFGSEVALAGAIISTLLITLAGSNSYVLLVLLLVEGVIAGLLFGRFSSRQTSIKAVFYIVIASLISIFSLDLVHMSEWSDIALSSVAVLVGSIVGPILALALLPVFERFVGVVSNITVLEYADTNSPILQQLAIEAPGTFHHSMVVSNLAETAARAVGANPILTRVGAYYHDIGKLVHPEYFSENQQDTNPHENLNPHMSFMVLSAHVKEGVRLGKMHGLPDPVLDIIREHHGDNVMWYFYEKAKAKDSSVSEDAFKYEGPKPQSRESAIVMLADTVEASVRSRDDLDKKSMEKLISSSIDEKMAEGQFDNCELTTRDLTLIKDAFLRILQGVKHKRTPIPPRGDFGEGIISNQEDNN